MRKPLFVLIFLCFAALCGADTFPISFWEAPHTLDEATVKDVAECGFNVYFDYIHKTPEEQKILLDLCRKYGMKSHVYDERISRPDFSDSEWESKVAEAVAEYKDHPALWGYHIADEPFPSVFHEKADILRVVKKTDPSKIAFINMHCYTVPPFFRPQCDYGDHIRYIDEIMNLCRSDLLGYDQYVLMKDRANDYLDNYFRNLSIIGPAALKYDVPFNSIILDIEHFIFRDPTDDDIRWQVYTSLAYGAKGILYFTYAVPTGDPNYVWGDALTDREGNKTRRYYAARKLNGEIAALGDTLLDLTSVGVFHTGRLYGGCQPVPEENLIKLTGGEFVLGQFRASDGSLYAMVTNRSMTEKQTALLRFAQRVKVSEVEPHGGFGVQYAPDRWQKTLLPGDGALIKIEPAGILRAKWDYFAKPMPRVSIFAPDESSARIAENVKDELAGKVNVFVIGSDSDDPAHTARRLRSDAYVILGFRSCFMPFNRDMSEKLAKSIDPAADENISAFGDITHIFCPAAVVDAGKPPKLAEGILRYFGL